MIVFPAIDILDGKVVRLHQGRLDAVTVYNDDPVDQARQWVAGGAEWLHVVDLDGAKAGRPVNTKTIAGIAALGVLKVEVGGPGDFTRLSKQGILEKLQEKAGPEARKLFEKFMRDVEKLQAEQWAERSH